jgi:excisionase family DNA binding protein
VNKPGPEQVQEGVHVNKLMYRPNEAAEILSISRDKLYDLMRVGRLRSVKDGRARFITADALSDYIRQLEEEAGHLPPAIQEDDGRN